MKKKANYTLITKDVRIVSYDCTKGKMIRVSFKDDLGSLLGFERISVSVNNDILYFEDGKNSGFKLSHYGFLVARKQVVSVLEKWEGEYDLIYDNDTGNYCIKKLDRTCTDYSKSYGACKGIKRNNYVPHSCLRPEVVKTNSVEENLLDDSDISIGTPKKSQNKDFSIIAKALIDYAVNKAKDKDWKAVIDALEELKNHI